MSFIAHQTKTHSSHDTSKQKNSLEFVGEIGVSEGGVGVNTLRREGQHDHEQGQVPPSHEEVFDLINQLIR